MDEAAIPTTYTNGNPGKVLRNFTIINEQLRGKSCKQIGDKVGLSKMQVSNILRSKDIQPYRDHLYRKLFTIGINEVPTNYNELLQSENERIKLDATRDIAQIIGISGANTPPALQQYIQINQQISVDSELKSAYDQCFSPIDDDIEVIDVELADDNSNTEGVD